MKKRLRDCTLKELDSYCHEHSCEDCPLEAFDDRPCDLRRILRDKLDTEIDLD